MSRWFRWYEGTSEDGKFRLVARLSRVTVRDVIALWAFMLEDAAHLEHRGVCKRNEDFMSSILDFDEGVVERVLSAMQTASMISVEDGDISICNWGKRQFEGDTDPTANERQRRHRNKTKPVTNAPVTRDSRPPETETETETEAEKDKISEAIASGEVVAFTPRSKAEPISESWEDKFWSLKTSAQAAGITASRMGQLANLNGGDFQSCCRLLEQSLTTRSPSAYFGKAVAGLREELSPTAATPRSKSTPEFVHAAKDEGRFVQKLDDGKWKIGAEIFNAEGRMVGW